MTRSAGHSHRYDVVVIGGGHNGLTTAAMLAKQGRKVLVVERRAVVGGIAVGEEFHPGCRSVGLVHDTTTVSPHVVADLGLERHGLKVVNETPPVFAPQTEGRGLLLHRDPSKASEEISSLSLKDADAYGKYSAFLSRISQFLKRVFHEPPLDLLTNGRGAFWPLAANGLALRRLGRTDMLDLLRIAPMCVADWLSEWFETELLKSVLAGPAIHGTFMGPWSPGSNANLLRREGLAAPSIPGGPEALIDALAGAARAAGVDLRTNTEVSRVRVAVDRVEGVTLAGGETIDAPVVAASCDPKSTLLQLIGGCDITPKLAQRIKAYRACGTTAKVNLALTAPLRFACRPDLEVEFARTGETLDDMERAFDAVKYRRFSVAPILDIYAPPRAGTQGPSAPSPASNAAGGGPCHIVSILAHFAPYDLDGGWSDDQREQLGDTIIDALCRYAPNVRDSIVAREVLTPVDIERRFGLTGGHIHHGDHALDQLLVRPTPECARYATPVEGLFLCGSGSHPGGGLTCVPGTLAASAMLKHRA